MKKIYILTRCNYEWFDIVGVYESKIKAEAIKADFEGQQTEWEPHLQDSFSITEHTIQ